MNHALDAILYQYNELLRQNAESAQLRREGKSVCVECPLISGCDLPPQVKLVPRAELEKAQAVIEALKETIDVLIFQRDDARQEIDDVKGRYE